MEETNSGYILTIDIGTSSIRAFIWNQNAEIIGRSSKQITLLYPNPGHVELDPLDLWKLCKSVVRGSVKDAKVSVSSLKGIGISVNRGLH